MKQRGLFLSKLTIEPDLVAGKKVWHRVSLIVQALLTHTVGELLAHVMRLDRSNIALIGDKVDRRNLDLLGLVLCSATARRTLVTHNLIF